MAEIWDLYDKQKNKTDKTMERGKPYKKGFYHIVVNGWIITDDNQILITKRDQNKPFGNMWEVSGGSILTGESSLEGVLREVKEETGITLHSEGKFIQSILRECYHDFLDVWLFNENVSLDMFKPQIGETTEARLVKMEEIIELLEKGEFVNTYPPMIEIINEVKKHIM